jgi:hypothetical protein
MTVEETAPHVDGVRPSQLLEAWRAADRAANLAHDLATTTSRSAETARRAADAAEATAQAAQAALEAARHTAESAARALREARDSVEAAEIDLQRRDGDARQADAAASAARDAFHDGETRQLSRSASRGPS